METPVRIGNKVIAADAKSLEPLKRAFGSKPVAGNTSSVITGWPGPAELIRDDAVQKSLAEIGNYKNLQEIPEATRRALRERYGISIAEYDLSRNRLVLSLNTKEPLGYASLQSLAEGDQVVPGARGAGGVPLVRGEVQPSRQLQLVFGESKEGAGDIGLRGVFVGPLAPPALPLDLTRQIATLRNAGVAAKDVRKAASDWYAAHPSEAKDWTKERLEEAAIFWKDHALCVTPEAYEKAAAASKKPILSLAPQNAPRTPSGDAHRSVAAHEAKPVTPESRPAHANPPHQSSTSSLSATDAAKVRKETLAWMKGSGADSQALLGRLSNDHQIAALFAKSAKANEGYTVGTHTERVLNAFKRQIDGGLSLASVQVPEGTDINELMRFTLSLHDIGKGPAIEAGAKALQHQYTLPILEAQMRKFGFNEAEIRIAKALVDNDVLGALGKGTISLEEAHQQLVALAAQAGLSPDGFFRLQYAFYTSDAGSYPSLRKLFVLRDGVMTPKGKAFEELALRFNREHPVIPPPTAPRAPRVDGTFRGPGPASRILRQEGVPEIAQQITGPVQDAMAARRSPAYATLEIPRTETLEEAQYEEIQERIRKLAERGPAGFKDATAIISSYKKSAAMIPKNKIFSTFINKIERAEKILEEIPVMEIHTRPAPVYHTPPVDKSIIHNGAKMSDIEKNFDVLARKAAAPRAGFAHEVDVAFASCGIPENVVHVGDGNVTVARDGNVATSGGARRTTFNEKVYSVGSDGAINFQGKRSTTGGERLYGLIFDKGFVAQYGEDLRNAQGMFGANPSAETFQANYARHGSVFAVRTETSTHTLGQVHVQLGDDWSNMVIDGHKISQSDFVRQHVLGIVEFDANGNVIATRMLSRPAQ